MKGRWSRFERAWLRYGEWLRLCREHPNADPGQAWKAAKRLVP